MMLSVRQSGWPRRWVYPGVGAALALAAPLGLGLLRCALAREVPTWTWFRHDVGTQAATYAYITTYAAIVFVVLGSAIGRIQDELSASSVTDPLTGLANRRQLQARLTDELRRVARYDTPISLLLIDVDRLKQINDEGGHAAGDRVLRAVADSLRGTCRATDLAARVGGDEFAILAPSTSASEALALAERLQSDLRQLGATVSPHLSVSIGITDRERAESPRADAMLLAADEALYLAKALGRDRAVLASRSTRARAQRARQEAHDHASGLYAT